MPQSWSGIKKRLETDMLCPVLSGRVKYFVTKYRKTHDESGRVAILVDDREIIQGNIFRYYKGQRDVEQRIKAELHVSHRVWDGKVFLNDKANTEAEELVDAIRLEEGLFDVWQFTDAIECYLNQSIQASLNSENPLIRLLAILDRRVGKRTLIDVCERLDEQPEWLRYFYELRLKSEHIAF
ncbi:hypothetical protein [Fusibacter sp. 3D3]|uniref:SF0329 family protein n=1 Tax=Fusibacter sp. 3D3 TaxID=1048380 RepID=UPI000853D081|nr:hypothetical protein [Fusibacter sp. 3D3]GAU76628.1 hypothetical protein F3D3_1225 [Fusibacter sp. 3D3]